ncbi:MAG TPA: type II toxin-antitoxin system VapC family toxin [Candidatus Acidoferrum sp.]|nr:type II toxin-antitoxin system VapC family toxin [Candidatus Acidoferrum sp.]
MILLDTHVLIWMTNDPLKLSKKAENAIRAAASGGGLAISAMTLWELAYLAARGRVNPSGTIEAFVRKITSRVAIQPITPEIAVIASQFPASYPADPTDKLIGATALVEGMALVTADKKILQSGQVRTIW